MEKIRHKHTLARNHFSKMAVMSKYFKAEQQHLQPPHPGVFTESNFKGGRARGYIEVANLVMMNVLSLL